MIVKLIKSIWLDIQCRKIMNKYDRENKKPIPSYAETESYRKPKSPAVSCTCGNPKVTKEWDDDLGAFYFFIECVKCNHYWEGPIYVMAINEFK